MSFLAPMRLWLLAAVVALAGAYLVMQLRRRSYAVRFTNLDLLDRVAPRRPGWRRHLAATAFVLAVAMLVVGFAQPAVTEQVPERRATIIVAIDTSLSMKADDVDPDRFASAKDAATTFIEDLPLPLEVGIVGFNGVASIVLPPTADRQLAVRAVNGLELGPGTAIGEAIFAGLGAIAAAPADELGEPPPGRIVLLSDGETTTGRPDETAARAALEAGVAVSTIAFGTDAGVVSVPEQDTTVPVPVNESALKQIAVATGGSFFTAVTGDELRQVYDDIGTTVGFTTEQREVTVWFVGAGIVTLLVAAGLSLAWSNRML